MSPELAIDVINQLQELSFQGTLFLHVLGEPLLHPNVFNLIEHAGQAGIRPVIFTNGGALTDTVVADILKSTVAEVVISMQTINQPSYEKLRKTPFEWETYMGRIQKALAKADASEQNGNQCTFRVSMGIKKTETARPEELYFLEYESLEQIKASIANIFRRVENAELADVFAQLDRSGVSQMPNMQLSERLGLSVKPMGNWRRIWRQDAVKRGQCRFVGRELAILSNGAVTHCHLDYDGRTTMGNVTETSLMEIFEQPAVQNDVKGFMMHNIVPEGCRYCRAITDNAA
jgi:radical SAM protein with 4Fe4S-binding SPASM domain